MPELLTPAAIILGPVMIVALVSLIRRSVRFRWANVFRLYLTLLFGFFGLYGHILHPQSVVDLIPPFFPLRVESSYASGALPCLPEISFNHRRPSPVANQPTMVAGNKMIDEAKMGGITPDMFSFNGKWDD